MPRFEPAELPGRGVSPLQRLPAGLLPHAPILYLKRDDLLHPVVSGNKWRKLVPQARWLLRGGASGFATVGGAHSNHLPAVAALCAAFQVPSIGYVREGTGWETPTLRYATARGMGLASVSRGELRKWRRGVGEPRLPTGYAWLPEGGTTRLALIGMAECVREVERALGGAPDAYVVPAGSGGTAAGLARATAAQVYAMDVVGDVGLPERTRQLLGDDKAHARIRWADASLGGFASGERVVWEAAREFADATGVRLDPMYGAKAWLGLGHLLGTGALDGARRIVIVHTGGLQGVKAWRRRYGYAESV